MKKSSSILVGLVVVVVLAVGAYLIFHKSSTTPAYSSNSSANNGSANKPAATAVNNAVLKTRTSSPIGQYLTDPAGKALYTYGGDTSGVSNCTGSCLASWPAYGPKGSVSGLPSGVSTITRSDNHQSQYTYNGLPLYYFVADSGTKVTGNGVQNFTVAKPVAANSSSSPSSSSGTSGAGGSSSSPNSPY